MIKIFYSWQSDVSSKTTRNHIENALKGAVKDIVKTEHIEIEIDQATREVAGTPDIPSTIVDKIKNSDIFIADITIINNRSKFRKCPNPNVLFELGIASEALSWDRIITVCNTHHGEVESLPFDIKFRRHMLYSLGPEENKKDSKKWLINSLTEGIKQIGFDSSRIRLNEIKKLILGSDYTATCKLPITNKIDTVDISGKAKITHLTHNIFQLEFLSYQKGVKFIKGDWNAQIYLNPEFPLSGRLVFESKIDFGLKEVILQLTEEKICIKLIGINHQGEGYGKEVLVKYLK